MVGDGRGWLCRCNRSYCQCSVPSIRAKALEIEMPANEWQPSALIPGWRPEVVLQHANTTYSIVRFLEESPFPAQSSRGDSYSGSRFPCISRSRQILHCDLQIARICAAMPCNALSSAYRPREHADPVLEETNGLGGMLVLKRVSPHYPARC